MSPRHSIASLADFVIGAAGEASNTGVVRVYLGEALYLRPFRYFVNEDDTLDLTTTGGMPWALTALHLTRIDDQPASIPLDFGTLDDNGERVFTVYAPPGTGVETVTFQAFALKGRVVVTSSEVVVDIN